MTPFTYIRATDAAGAMTAGAAPGVKYLAGGTTLIDLMKLNVETPGTVVDIGRLPMAEIAATADGGLRIGANVRNSDLAWHDTVAKRYAVLAEALLSGASPQLRNMATVGGNLLQRTRCTYFRDGESPCNKRTPGVGCSAKDGHHRMHAVLGTSDACFATHPSDMCVALAVLDATIHVLGPMGAREIPFAEFHRLPGDAPHRESALTAGELIVAVTLPAPPPGRSHYLKVRDRASYEFALASAAVALHVADGVIQSARIALGGVATKPWRATDAEKSLIGKPPNAATFAAAGAIAFQDAVPRRDNAFKVTLGKRVVARALETAAQQEDRR